MDTTCMQMVFSLSYGVCHDEANLTLLEAVETQTVTTINAGQEPFFLNIAIVDGGYVFGMVVHNSNLNGIPPGVGYDLSVSTYDATGVGSGSSVAFCDTLNLGTTPVSVSVFHPEEVTPLLVPGGVFPHAFVRTDCNVDGTPDIADVVFLLDTLFSPITGGVLPCGEACDCNDDETIDVADAICAISSLFGSPAVPPPAPYPACGFDSEDTGLDCASYSACP